MFKNSLLILVLGAVAVHSEACDVKEQDAPIKYKDDQLIYNLNLTIQKSIKVEKMTLHKLHKELSEKIKKAVRSDKTKFHKQILESFEEIRKLEEQAQKRKVDIKACLNGKKKLKYIPLEFYKRVAMCDEEILTKSKALAAKETKIVKESLHVVEKLDSEWKACARRADILKCKTKIVVKITRAVRQEPAKITQIIAEAEPALLSLVPYAVTCSNKEAHVLMANGENIVKDIKTCIGEKFRLPLYKMLLD